MENHSELSLCAVCYEPFSDSRLFSIGVCNHLGICSMCSLRSRLLLNDFSCCFCKQDMEYVVCSHNVHAKFEDFDRWGDDIGPEYDYDSISRIFFPKQYYKREIYPLKQNSCPEKDCRKVCRDVQALKRHVRAAHDKVLCETCADNKNTFPSEQKVYDNGQYNRHLKNGNGEGCRGHPSCRLCKIRFYDIDELFQHLEREHFKCHVCPSDSSTMTYFRDYSSLHTHFEREHHMCQERECLEDKFTVFSNQIALIIHYKQVHPSSKLCTNPMIMNKKKTFKDTTSEKYTVCRNYEGGVGGFVTNGEWFVKIEDENLMSCVEKEVHQPTHANINLNENEYPAIANPQKSSAAVINKLANFDKRFKMKSNPKKARKYVLNFSDVMTSHQTTKSSFDSNFPTLDSSTPVEKGEKKRLKINTQNTSPGWGKALREFGFIDNKKRHFNNKSSTFKKISVHKTAAL